MIALDSQSLLAPTSGGERDGESRYGIIVASHGFISLGDNMWVKSITNMDMYKITRPQFLFHATVIHIESIF
jgi:hypothetical protein